MADEKSEVRTSFRCPRCDERDEFYCVCNERADVTPPSDVHGPLHGEVPSLPCVAMCHVCGWSGRVPLGRVVVVPAWMGEAIRQGWKPRMVLPPAEAWKAMQADLNSAGSS